MGRSLFLGNILILSAALAGCGGGPAGGGDAGTDMKMGPKQPPLFVDGPDGGVPADESCLGTRKDPPAPTDDTVITGKIVDFQDDNIVVGAVVKVYATAADVPNNPIATSMPSANDGTYTITVPKGHYRVIFSNSGGKAINDGNPVDTIDTYEFNQIYNDKDRTAVKVSTREAIPGLVSVIPDESLGVLAGSVRDCNNKEVGGARVTVSMTSMPYDADALTFYFVEVNKSTLPTRTQKWTSGNGAFAALNVPVGMGTVTASGIVGSGEPQVLGSATVPLQPGAITIVEVIPRGM